MTESKTHPDPFVGIDSGPNSPAQALIGDLLAQARGRALRALLAAFEHLLEQQSWARDRLAAHAGRTLLIAFDLPPVPGWPAPEVRATIDPAGLLRIADPMAAADVTLRFRPSVEAVFAFAQDGAQGVQRHLRIDGDVGLAAALGELAQHLRWDAEEDLSRIVGDVAAHRIARFVGSATGSLREIGGRARSALAQFAAGGSQVVVAPQLDALSAAAAALDPRLRALEARLERLRAGTGPAEG